MKRRQQGLPPPGSASRGCARGNPKRIVAELSLIATKRTDNVVLHHRAMLIEPLVQPAKVFVAPKNRKKPHARGRRWRTRPPKAVHAPPSQQKTVMNVMMQTVRVTEIGDSEVVHSLPGERRQSAYDVEPHR